MDGTYIFWGAGICSSIGGASWMFNCDPENDDMLMSYYGNDYCLGNPDSELSMKDVFVQMNVTDYTISCCTGHQCDYATETTYQAGDCWDPSNEIESSNVYATDICMSGQTHSYIFECYNDTLTAHHYGNSYCSGTPIFSDRRIEGCNDGNISTLISCDNTAINTCDLYPPTTRSPTGSPIEWIEPFTTTMYPITDDLNWYN